MNRDDFKAFLKGYRDFQDAGNELYKIGIDLTLDSSRYPIQHYAEKSIDVLLRSIYTQDGIDWLDWFIYDCDFGRKIKEAYDGDKLICQTEDELFDYIKQYKL